MVVVTVTGEANLRDACEALDALTQEFRSWKRSRSAVFNFEGISNVDSRVRRAVTDWRSKNALLIATSVYSGSYVVPSAIIRGALTAMNWVKKPDVELIAYCSNLAEALAQSEMWEAQRRR